MLAWRADAGCSGLIEPEQAQMIMELIMTEGFLSNPDIVGTQKVAVTKIPAEFLDSAYEECCLIFCISKNHANQWQPKCEQEWQHATAVAKAFQIGKGEAAAVANLMTKVPACAVEFLTQSVKARGMSRYMSHDILGKDLFNASFSSGTGCLEHWKDQLRNNDELVMLFANRIQSDHDQTPPSLRKALTHAQALSKHQACAAFLHFLGLLEQMSPPADFAAAKKSLLSQFQSGYLDPDLAHALDSQFPPGDAASVGAFRPFIARIEKAQRLAKEAQEQEVEKSIRQADVKAVLAKLQSDLEVLAARLPQDAQTALKNAKDVKYIRDRKGEQYVTEWMAKHCMLVQVEDDYSGAVSAFLKFREQFRGRPGDELLASNIKDCRYAIVGFDATVWPSNASQVANATHILRSLLSMSSTNIGFVQYPVLQSQTNQSAVVKHRHLLDLALLKGGLTLSNNIQALYTKPESSQKDARSMCQLAVASFHGNFSDASFLESQGVRSGKIGPCPLIRVSDFQGFDDDSKPSPSARAEQTLVRI
ncbi:Uncharacterized protein SCF082_LOCUS10261 [Durusdinium trenchii]|uniref:Uncharacterized protein n=1 Tax=Durusdinium trenchii TaxID=1381693 RepID=A0ABP0J4V4_9DINO